MASDPPSDGVAVGWRPTVALSTAVGAIALLLVLAVILHRQDLFVLAVPLTVGTVGPLLNRSHRVPVPRMRVGAAGLLEGQSTTLYRELAAGSPLDLVRLPVETVGWLQPVDAEVCAVPVAGAGLRLEHRLVSTRWGRGQVRLIGLIAITGHGLLRAEYPVTQVLAVNTVPLREGFRATDLVPSAAGVVGAHRSRRTGEGIDPAGVRPFVAGDRMRRVNWSVSLRTGELHVTATYSDRDAELVLVLDTSAEVGTSTGLAGSSNNLDIAVRAAAAMAEHYLRNGDRVGLLNLSRAGRPIRSRSGRAQLIRLVDTLLDVRRMSVTDGELARALGRISHQALVIVLTPLLSDGLAEQVAGLARAGRSVIVVDTLPPEVVFDSDGPWTELAWRIKQLHRQNLIGALSDHGVPVVRWEGSGSLDQVLIQLSRLAGAPRVRR